MPDELRETTNDAAIADIRRLPQFVGLLPSFVTSRDIADREAFGLVVSVRLFSPVSGLKDRSASLARHNRMDLHSRRDGVQRYERQVGIRRRVEQARHRAEDARNADLWRFRRVETVRPPDSLV